MKNQIKSRLILAALFVLLAVAINACKKEEDNHDDDANDHDKPVLVLSSPTNLQSYTSGDTIKIKGLLTDASLHECFIKIVNDTDNSVLFNFVPLVHDLSSYTINSFWKSNVTAHTNASVIVVAEDHNSNIAADTVHIHIMP